MSTWKELSDTKCPFFKRVRMESREIVCEAEIDEASVSAQRFASRPRMKRHFRDFCCEMEYQGCPHYKAVLEKWKE